MVKRGNLGRETYIKVYWKSIKYEMKYAYNGVGQIITVILVTYVQIQDV